MTIRVLRILEYEYPDASAMISDMERWGVGANGVSRNGENTIRSATFQPTETVVTNMPAARVDYTTVGNVGNVSANAGVIDGTVDQIVYLRDGVDAEKMVMDAEARKVRHGTTYKIIDLRTTDPKTGETIHRTE